MTKPFDIPKQLFVEAFEHVKEKAGAAGVDRQSLEEFQRCLKDNTYKLWNRMSSGSYFPPPVMAVSIPKKAGGVRILGVPTVADRIAQQVVRLVFEPLVEPYFHPNSYGYRPNKSALDAIKITRERCWHYDWVLEYDIKGLFDNIPHDLLMKAVRKHTDCGWIILYIERWLKAPMQASDGELVARDRGTPQGGVISPVLSNLFMHYAFDVWMQKQHPEKSWCRYADDGLIHCETLEQAQSLTQELRLRFDECGLELHPDKTRIIYCKDDKRKDNHEKTSFDFLGYTFQGRRSKSAKSGKVFRNFVPAVSHTSLMAMRKKTKKLNWRNRTELSLEEIAERYNPVLRGWLNYYGAYYRSALNPVWQHFNKTLVAWAMKKYKNLSGKTEAHKFIMDVAKSEPQLFVHWKQGVIHSFV